MQSTTFLHPSNILYTHILASKYIFTACTFVFTWQTTKAIDDLLSPLLQREPVLTHHQPKHDQRHKLTSVGLHRSIQTGYSEIQRRRRLQPVVHVM